MGSDFSVTGQDRLTSRLAGMLDEGRGLRDTLRLCLVAVGRGGQGDVGQRIRDEILHVQSQNNAKVRPMPVCAAILCHPASPVLLCLCRAPLCVLHYTHLRSHARIMISFSSGPQADLYLIRIGT